MQSGWLHEFQRSTSEQSKAGDEPSDVSRRDFLHGGLVSGVAAGMAAGGVLAQAQVAQAQPAAAGDTPIGPKWWPSRWGPQDEAGASNWITPA